MLNAVPLHLLLLIANIMSAQLLSMSEEDCGIWCREAVGVQSMPGAGNRTQECESECFVDQHDLCWLLNRRFHPRTTIISMEQSMPAGESLPRINPSDTQCRSFCERAVGVTRDRRQECTEDCIHDHRDLCWQMLLNFHPLS